MGGVNPLLDLIPEAAVFVDCHKLDYELLYFYAFNRVTFVFPQINLIVHAIKSLAQILQLSPEDSPSSCKYPPRIFTNFDSNPVSHVELKKNQKLGEINFFQQTENPVNVKTIKNSRKKNSE